MANLPFGWDDVLKRLKRYDSAAEARTELQAFSIFNGTGAPGAGLGVDGDFYIDTAAVEIYGPKAGGAWGAGTALTGPQGPQGPQGPEGPQGPQGDPGADGPAGADGKTVLNGAGVPDPGTGVDGDFYIDTNNDDIYGPKTGGAWGLPTSLVGPQGVEGPQGPPGPTGTQHVQWMIPNPVLNDDLLFPGDSRDITIVGVRAGLPGATSTPSVTWNLYHAPSFDTPLGTRSKVFASSKTTTTTSTPDDHTPDGDPTVPLDRVMSLNISALSGIIPWLSLSIEYTVD